MSRWCRQAACWSSTARWWTGRRSATIFGVIDVPANDIADELGDRRLANMVMLGAMLAETDLLPLESVEKALEAHLPARHRELLAANYQALQRGAALARVPA